MVYLTLQVDERARLRSRLHSTPGPDLGPGLWLERVS